MKTEIYYFSGTGNSLVVAKDIARRTNGKLISIPTMMDNYTIQIDADIIGIVFPTYYEPYGGVPLIVRKFARKLEKINSKYLLPSAHMGVVLSKLLTVWKKLSNLEEANLQQDSPLTCLITWLDHPLTILKNRKMFHVWEENID